MKIRSIQLTNFRKFVGTVAVDGISDGVNLLVGQNEAGKSTLLEAINGVIFEKAKSQSELVKRLPQQNLWGDSGSGSRPKL
jgi:DNA repair exonuclease SbcCD ATPase subunit